MNEFDPQAPFIASDGWEYADFAERLLGKKRRCYYNAQLERYIELSYPDQVFVFKEKYRVFRQSTAYDDRNAEGYDRGIHIDYADAAADFEGWCNGPDDPTPYSAIPVPDDADLFPF